MFEAGKTVGAVAAERELSPELVEELHKTWIARERAAG